MVTEAQCLGLLSRRGQHPSRISNQGNREDDVLRVYRRLLELKEWKYI